MIVYCGQVCRHTEEAGHNYRQEYNTHDPDRIAMDTLVNKREGFEKRVLDNVSKRFRRDSKKLYEDPVDETGIDVDKSNRGIFHCDKERCSQICAKQLEEMEIPLLDFRFGPEASVAS